MKPVIADGQTVTIHYRLTLDDGTIADDSFGADPLVYLHGESHIVPGLERDLAGKSVGDECQIEVDPADGYGNFDPAAQQSVARSQFPSDVDIRPGMQFQVEGPQGPVPVWVRNVEDGQVTITTNHPLAGQRLRFDVRVLDVRETVAEDQPADESG